MKTLIEKAIERGLKYSGQDLKNIIINSNRKTIHFFIETIKEDNNSKMVSIQCFKLKFGDFLSNYSFIGKLIEEKDYLEYVKAEDKIKFLKENIKNGEESKNKN